MLIIIHDSYIPSRSQTRVLLFYISVYFFPRTPYIAASKTDQINSKYVSVFAFVSEQRSDTKANTHTRARANKLQCVHCLQVKKISRAILRAFPQLASEIYYQSRCVSESNKCPEWEAKTDESKPLVLNSHQVLLTERIIYGSSGFKPITGLFTTLRVPRKLIIPNGMLRFSHAPTRQVAFKLDAAWTPRKCGGDHTRSRV